MFGVEFGKPYLNLLETESMVPDSNDAAIGFGVLRRSVTVCKQRIRINSSLYLRINQFLDDGDTQK